MNSFTYVAPAIGLVAALGIAVSFWWPLRLLIREVREFRVTVEGAILRLRDTEGMLRQAAKLEGLTTSMSQTLNDQQQRLDQIARGLAELKLKMPKKDERSARSENPPIMPPSNAARIGDSAVRATIAGKPSSQNEAQVDKPAVQSALQVCSDLLDRLADAGMNSDLAKTRGLKNWVESMDGDFAMEPLSTRDPYWLLCVLSTKEKNGYVVPALDIPIGVNSPLMKWFEYDPKEYDGTQALKRADVVKLASAKWDAKLNQWVLGAEKGRIQRPLD